MLRWMGSVTRKDKLRNESFRKKLEMAPVNNKMRGSHLRWYGHMHYRLMLPLAHHLKPTFDHVHHGGWSHVCQIDS